MGRTSEAVSAVGRRMTYANVMSTVAFTLALGGGTAYASHLVVDSSDIVDGEVRAVDLRNSSVTAAKIRDGEVGTADVADSSLTGTDVADSSLTGTDVLGGSLTGSDLLDRTVTGTDVALGTLRGDLVADGSLTGADVATSSITGSDVLESSLGEVNQATNARAVNGETVQRIEFLANSGTPERQVLSTTAGLRLYAECSSSGDLEVIARTAGNARLFSWSVDSDAGTLDNIWSLEDFQSAHAPDLVNTDDGDQSGQTAYMTSAGGVTIVSWAADNNTSGAFPTQCAFVGTSATH